MAFLRFTTFRIDRSLEKRSTDGALVVAGRMSRADNVQVYGLGDGTSRREFRPRDEVFDAESLRSFDGVTVTIGHPRGMVSPRNFKDVGVGHIQNIRSGGDHVLADFVIMDSEAIAMIEDRELEELSAGYFADLDMSGGEAPNGDRYDAIQRNIRGNHVALLPNGQARAGRSARLVIDSDGNETPLFVEKVEVDTMKKTFVIDGISYTVEAESESAIQALEKKMRSDAARIKVLGGEISKLKGKLDAATKEIEDLKQKNKDLSDHSRVDQLIAERTELISRAKTIAGDDADTSGTNLEIMTASLEKAGVKVDGKDEGYILARFDAAYEYAEKDNDKRDHSLAGNGKVAEVIDKNNAKKQVKFSRAEKARRDYMSQYGG